MRPSFGRSASKTPTWDGRSPNRPSGLDEYELTRHYQHWREDLALAASLGAKQARYGFPWYRVNPARGVWDWTFADAVVDEANRLGLGLIVDLVHYGTPTWLKGSFTDPDYPDAVANYACAVARRYRGRIASITPLNEPLVTASFVGLRGIWPPHETGEDGWSRVVVSLAEGIQRSIHAIRKAAPEMQIVHVEATHIWTARNRRSARSSPCSSGRIFCRPTSCWDASGRVTRFTIGSSNRALRASGSPRSPSARPRPTSSG